jgi:outer membrane protein assembly factor BamB
MSGDQVTSRRTRKLGLTAHDPSKAFPGYTLYAPMFGDGEAYLLDMDGNVVHEWKSPLEPGDYVYLLPNGNLFALGKTPAPPGENFPAWHVFKGGAMFELDWDSNIVWEHRDPAHHHDGRRTESGGAIYLTIEELPSELVPRVQGGLPGTEHHGKMWGDRVVEVDRDGKLLWEWHAHEHLDPATEIITPTDLRHEWSHANTVVPLPGGDVMVSFRNISTVVRIDRATGDIVWKLRPPLLAQQHDPNMLDNGNVLIFNNGSRRANMPLIFSSVIEVEPESGKVVWEYRDPSSMLSFFSSYISGVQRLPNSNTLICEGLTGRIFEVTPMCEVVWEYINPHYYRAQVFGESNAVFRAFRYGTERFPRL